MDERPLAAGPGQRGADDLVAGQPLWAAELDAGRRVRAALEHGRERGRDVPAQIGWNSARPAPLSGTAGSSARRRTSAVKRSERSTTSDGATTVEGTGASRTARSATALARRNRARLWTSPRPRRGRRNAAPRRARPPRRAARSRCRRAPRSTRRAGRAGSGPGGPRRSTPRRALRNDGGSARSPRASCTRTRSAPEATRVAHQAADRRARRHEPLEEGRPTTPVAPVSRSIGGGAYRGALGRPPCPPRPPHSEVPNRNGLRHRRAVHRHQGQLVRRGVPGRLHPPDPDEPDYDKVESSTSTPRSASTATPASRPARSTPASPRTSCPTSGSSFAEINAQYFQGR